VLLFIALLDRKAEIILGDGVDTREDVDRSQELMRERIIPALREGETDAAVLAGARGLKALLASALLNQGLELGLEQPLEQKPSPKETRQPVREPKEFVDDEGMYVELSSSSSSAGENAPALTSGTKEPPPLTEPSARAESTPHASRQTLVAPWVWAVVAGFILLLIVGNVLRRRGVACERCGSTNVKVSTSTLLEAGDHNDGLVTVTVRCRRCGHTGTSTRETSSRRHSHSHSHGGSHGSSHGGGRSSGGGASGSW
jgi:uncharacterized protein